MIKFYSNNLLETSLFSATSENALFPVLNIMDYRRSKVYRSNSNSSSIVMDFGSMKEMDSIIIVDNPRSGFGFNSASIEFSNDGINYFNNTIVNINHTHGFAHAEFDLINYRYARLNLSSHLAYCEVSNIFVGKKISFESGMGIDLGWSYKDKELSMVKENRYGQKFIDKITRQKEINFSIRSMNKDELDQIFEIYDLKSSISPFFARIGCSDMANDIDRFAGMFFLNNIPQITNKSFGLYDISMTIEEAM